MTYQPPDLSHLKIEEIVPLMLACARSDDPSDKAFARACRDEIAHRKPEPPSQGTEP